MTETDNKHVWEYLTYYLELPHSPFFAVLISGPWGIGKTFLLKKFLQEKFGEERNQYVYVSLYGLSTIEEIDDALLQAIFPILTGTTAKVVGRIAKAGLKYFQVDSGNFNIREFLNKFDAKIYIFDDLERCEAPINKVLGYINHFVEHSGAKVIIVANEKEIKTHTEYKQRREKLIGKTLHVQSSLKDALSYFVSKIDDIESQRFLENNASEASMVYTQSGLNNLRILQQTIWDFERFYKVLSPEHRENNNAMQALLRLLFALSFELKAARINEEDLIKGRGLTAMTIARLNDKNNKTPMMIANERYPLIDLNDDLLSTELLVDYLVRGIIDTQAIQSQLQASRFFINVAEEAPWRTVWHWLERSEADFERALATIEKQFTTRTFVHIGEILHILGLRLFLSDRSVLKLSRANVVQEGKKYIDDVYKTKTLQLPHPNELSELRPFDSWGGLGIHEHNSPEYKKLFSYLTKIRQRAIEDTYPQIAADLLAEMKTDVEKFYRLLCQPSSDGDSYVHTPVLAKLDPDVFVDTFLNLHPRDHYVVMTMFGSRYAHGQLNRDLKEEKKWAKAIRAKLMAKIIEMSPIGKYRLEKLIEWHMKALAN